jgi:hypothetical protein
MRPQRKDDRSQANQGSKDDDRHRPAFVEVACHPRGRGAERWITGHRWTVPNASAQRISLEDDAGSALDLCAIES